MAAETVLQKLKTTKTSIKQAFVYYTTSLLIRLNHEKEIVNIIHFPVYVVRGPSNHEYFIEEFPSKLNEDMKDACGYSTHSYRS
jgi:hypothetical protein